MSKVLVIEAAFYTDIADHLRAGAIDAIEKNKASYDVVTVPGALEIPAALNFGIKSGQYDAYVVLGCVIRGETSHYDIVCGESARGVYDLTLAHDLAIGNAILTVENQEQAIRRADPVQNNKGGEAAQCALDMLALKKKFLG